MAQENRENNKTGKDVPAADGSVSDEDVNAITDDKADRPTGQDHSTENYGDSFPDHGVGAVQNAHDPTQDIANIDD